MQHFGHVFLIGAALFPQIIRATRSYAIIFVGKDPQMIFLSSFFSEISGDGTRLQLLTLAPKM